MSRSYRHFVFALVGWLALVAAAQPKTGSREPQDRSSQEISAALENVAAALNADDEAPDYQQPCENGTNNRNSDLCAQWHAADAARDAANAAWAFGYVGMFLGLLTLGAAGAAAWYARKAAIHTEEGAKAAEATLDHAKSVTASQMRGYVSLGRVKIAQDADTWVITIKAINHGAMTAYRVEVDTAIEVYSIPMPAKRSTNYLVGAAFNAIRPQGFVKRMHPVTLTDDDVADIRALRKAVWMGVRITYVPGPNTEPETLEHERVFVGSDLDDMMARIVEEWMCQQPDEEGKEQGQLPLSSPEPE